MTALLVVADGAAATFSTTTTPQLDRLVHRAVLQTVPAGLPVASEVALPSLLGRWLSVAPARGAVEAAAIGRRLATDEAAWRLDAPALATAGDAVLDQAAVRLQSALDAETRHLRRGRFLLVGPVRWTTTPALPVAPIAEATIGVRVRLWGGGSTPRWRPLRRPTAVVASPTGAAAGVARLLGADVVAPAGATGFPDTDLEAKAGAAVNLVAAGEHDLVVVHVGAVDEAGHAQDRELQRMALARVDRELVGPLLSFATRAQTPLVVTADHGTDPVTGRHVGGPVPAFATVTIVDGRADGLVPRLLRERPISVARSAARTTGVAGRSVDGW